MKNLKQTMYFNLLGNGINFLNATKAVARLHGDTKAEKLYGDTEAHQAFVVNANSLGFTFGDDDRPERIVKAFFAASAQYLSNNKVAKTDEATVLTLLDVSGNFKFAGVVQYHENKDNPEEPGNWSYIMTFDPATIDNLKKEKSIKSLLYSSNEFQATYSKVAYDVAGIQFEHSNYMLDSCLLVIDTLVQILDREAKEGEVVDIEMPGYFTASVSVEDGEKIFAITPDGHMKQVIKDDTELDK